MVVLEKRPELNIASGYETDFGEANLSVERTDISFHDVAGDKVRIQVTVSNTGTRLSQQTTMRLESAPLGAFVPWQPLAQLVVPALEPGESRTLTIDMKRPRPAPLGDFNRVPPKKLLTAISADQPPQRARNGLIAILGLLDRGQKSPSRDMDRKDSLAPDLWDMVGRGQPHWAGNINVFIGRKPVERHLSRALRIYPGRTNMAMFIVGEPRKPDAYSFEIVGLSSDWKTALYDTTNNQNLLADHSRAPIKEMQWVEARNLMVMLATQPPIQCKVGKLEVHVTRRSSGTTAIVEFDLDPGAEGAGCYVV